MNEGVATSEESAIAVRHSGDLRGQLKTGDAVAARDVIISISARSARTHAGQALAVHLANLLGRLAGVVSSVGVEVDDIPLLEGVDPRAQRGEQLREAVERAAGIAIPAMRNSRMSVPKPLVIRVGIGVPADVYVAASSWIAFVGREEGPECRDGRRHGAAPHAAAALAAGEVFRILRANGGRSAGPAHFVFDVWNWWQIDAQQESAMDAHDADIRMPPICLVGVGAVGCAFLLTMWYLPIQAMITAIDKDDVSITNLNRYVLFGLLDRGKKKVSVAEAILSGHGITIAPVEAWWSEYLRSRADDRIPLLVSAVDTNVIRHQLQDALPRLILGGSTHGLRAEVARYDIAEESSRCLKCFNEPETTEEDAVLQRRLLGMSEDELRQEAEDRGVEAERLLAYVADLRAGGTGCAFVAGPELEKLRRRDGEGGFAVSFVSSMCGTLLAVQAIREAIAAPLLADNADRGVFQFWKPAANSNATFRSPRDLGCWCGNPMVRQTFRARWPLGGVVRD